MGKVRTDLPEVFDARQAEIAKAVKQAAEKALTFVFSTGDDAPHRRGR